MEQKKTRTQQRRERKRDIMQAAQELFCARGIPETSLVDIADAAATTRATLYKYFESKEEILKAILEDLLNNLMLEIEHLPEPEGTAESYRENLKGFFYTLFNKYRDQLKLLYGYNFIYTDENPGPPLRLNHLIAGKELFKAKAYEKKLSRIGIINPEKWNPIRLQVFLEGILGLAGQLAGRGGILEDVKGISPKAYLDTSLDIFLDSLG